jgi:chemotaxis protein methyltransferase CheR
MSVEQALIDAVEGRLGVKLRKPIQEQVLQAAKAFPEANGLPALLRRFQTADAADALFIALSDAASVGETSFYRSPAQVSRVEQFLKDELLPRRVREMDIPLRAWSAGCASGEEAYTLALMLAPLFHHSGSFVLGTDMNERALEKARKGCYGARALRSVPPELFTTRFVPSEEGYLVSPEVRRSVRFSQHNLVTDPLPDPSKGVREFDLVVCRNVIIYFDMDRIPQVIDGLGRCVKPGGGLVLADAEYLFGPQKGFTLREGGFFVKDG